MYHEQNYLLTDNITDLITTIIYSKYLSNLFEAINCLDPIKQICGEAILTFTMLVKAWTTNLQCNQPEHWIFPNSLPFKLNNVNSIKSSNKQYV